jgi:hypothetical protein
MQESSDVSTILQLLNCENKAENDLTKLDIIRFLHNSKILQYFSMTKN